jgi:hypothetical protein
MIYCTTRGPRGRRLALLIGFILASADVVNSRLSSRPYNRHQLRSSSQHP